jgi:phenylpyruvate tautomerase PptA (4-oxalocrotonate tautomerase family)
VAGQPRRGIVIIQVTLARGRPVEKKEALYQRIAERLGDMAGVEPRNVFVGLVEVGREDWSFGDGVAQYAMADRAAAGS